MADKTYAGLDKARVEELIAERIANAYLDTLGRDRLVEHAKNLLDRVTGKAALQLANRLYDDSGPEARRTFSARVVSSAADLLVKTQKQEARELERRRMVKAIRSPTVPHVLEELRHLAALEQTGKLRNARVPLLTLAYQEFGSYGAILKEVEGQGQLDLGPTAFASVQAPALVAP